MRSSLAIVALLCAAAASGDRRHPERGGAASARAADAAEATAQHWYREAAAGIAVRAARGAAGGAGGGGAARNVLMFLGDGMSLATLAAARALQGQRAGRTGEEEQLSFEKFPTVGLAKTYCVNEQIPDSACTATAYLCGVKNNYGTLGVTAAVSRRDCAASAAAAARVESVAEWALAAGRDVGIVTTTRVTHASPAGAYAKTANRGWENDAQVTADGHDVELCPDIAHQLVHMHPGNRFKVILGGGRREFLPNTTRDEEGTRGRREDNRNLIREWQDEKRARNVSHKYVWHRKELMEASHEPLPDYLLGLFEGTHLRYHMEGDPFSEPTLAELTEVAIRSLSRNEKGFFLFVESGRIDHAHHDNYPALALDETLELSRAVQRAAELLGDDSLLVVTADHAHVMAYNGYAHRGADILGPSDDIGDDGVPYMTLSYTNGPGARAHVDGIRPDVTKDRDYGSLRWQTHADVILESETHAGDDVGVFARGPQHGMFSGAYEQSQLPHLMAYAACLGPGAHAAACSADADTDANADTDADTDAANTAAAAAPPVTAPLILIATLTAFLLRCY